MYSFTLKILPHFVHPCSCCEAYVPLAKPRILTFLFLAIGFLYCPHNPSHCPPVNFTPANKIHAASQPSWRRSFLTPTALQSSWREHTGTTPAVHNRTNVQKPSPRSSVLVIVYPVSYIYNKSFFNIIYAGAILNIHVPF